MNIKLIKKIPEDIILDEIDNHLVNMLANECTVKQLAKSLMDNYKLNIEEALDKVNLLAYKLNALGLIKGYTE